MKIAVPLTRDLVWDVLKACWHCLRGHKVALEFECEDLSIDGDRPVLLSREQVREVQRRHMEAAARAALLEDMVKEALKDAQDNDPLAAELQEGLDAIDEPRVLH